MTSPFPADKKKKKCFSYIPLSSVSEPVHAVASYACFWLTGVKPDVVFRYCSPSASRFGMLCFSAYHGCEEWLSYCRLPGSSNYFLFSIYTL